MNNFNNRFYAFPNRNEAVKTSVMSLYEFVWQVVCKCLKYEKLSRHDSSHATQGDVTIQSMEVTHKAPPPCGEEAVSPGQFMVSVIRSWRRSVAL